MNHYPHLVSTALVKLPEPDGLPAEFARPMRRCDTLTRAAVTAVHHCLAQLDHGDVLHDLGECAIFTGLGTGTIGANLAFVDSLFEQDEGAGSPTLFSHSVHNTVAGYISRLFDIQGPSFTITDFAWPFLAALQEALGFVAAGKVKMAMVVTAENENPFIRDVRTLMVQEEISWQGGAAAWLITGSCPADLNGAVIKDFYLNMQACSPEELLLRLTERYPCQDGEQLPGPPGYVFSLDHAVREVMNSKMQQGHWCVRSLFGSACLSFHKS